MIFIRADANAKIGLGHLMRCIGIADAALINNDVVFYTAGEDAGDILKNHNIENVIINASYENMNSELQYFKEEILKKKPEVVFVDSYYVTPDYLQELYHSCKSYGGKLVYIDDIAKFAYPCDYLINYNLFGPDLLGDYKKMYKEKELPTMLLGGDYVPLRKEFSHIGERKVKETADSILVSSGGSDLVHITLEMVKYISERYKEKDCYTFNIIVGQLNHDLDEIKKIAANATNIHIFHSVSNMASLMCCNDVAISASGSTLYELCATQTPAITYTLADNQVKGAEKFKSLGLMRYVGDARLKGAHELAEELINQAVLLCKDYAERNIMAKKQKEAVSVNGAAAIISKVMESS